MLAPSLPLCTCIDDMCIVPPTPSLQEWAAGTRCSGSVRARKASLWCNAGKEHWSFAKCVSQGFLDLQGRLPLFLLFLLLCKFVQEVDAIITDRHLHKEWCICEM